MNYGLKNRCYSDILKERGALNKSIEEDVLNLNTELQPIVNTVHQSFPEMDMGYYSIELDSVLAIYPEMNSSKLLTTYHDLSHFNIYRTKKPEIVQLNASFEGNDKPRIWYTYPLLLKDYQVYGHIWASVKLETIYKEVAKISTIILLLWVTLVTSLLFYQVRKSNKVKGNI